MSSRPRPEPSASAERWRAYVDESGSNTQVDPDIYIFAATLADTDVLDDCSMAMRRLRRPGQKKLHWQSDVPSHADVAATVAVLPLEHVVVVRSCRPGERPERRRRGTLERLCWELEQLGVGAAVFESRGPADDRRDLVALQGFRARRVVSSTLRMHHLPGPKEPMLWIPDAVCGAVVSARTGNDAYFETIRSRITLVECG